LAHLVKLEWFDDGNNELHGHAFVSRIRTSRSRLDLRRSKSGIFLCEWHKKFATGAENNCPHGSPLASLSIGGCRIIRQDAVSSPAMMLRARQPHA
jgi:hypothetical protein